MAVKHHQREKKTKRRPGTYDIEKKRWPQNHTVKSHQITTKHNPRGDFTEECAHRAKGGRLRGERPAGTQTHSRPRKGSEKSNPNPKNISRHHQVRGIETPNSKEWGSDSTDPFNMKV